MDTAERLAYYFGQSPRVAPTAYIAPSAELIGAVTIGAYSSVWPMCVVRADINRIVIGEGSNIQDGTIIHLADDYGVSVGDYATIGHGAIIHACTIEDECLIGMHATVLDGAVIGRESIIGANALVPQGMQVPPGSMVLGVPGRITRELTHEERRGLKSWADKYIQLAAAYRARLQD